MKQISRDKFRDWLNGGEPTLLYQLKWQWGGLKFNLTQRHKDNACGRFGGGWQFKLGVDVGGSDLIVSYGVGTLRVTNYYSLAKKYPDMYTTKGKIETNDRV